MSKKFVVLGVCALSVVVTSLFANQANSQLGYENAALLSMVKALRKEVDLLKKGQLKTVRAFNLARCPDGWVDYEPAYGRFIRGIDRKDQGLDSEGIREPGSPQLDTLGKHAHSFTGKTVTRGGYAKESGRALSAGDVNHLYNTFTPSGTVGEFGHAETRPKNVALLYCTPK